METKLLADTPLGKIIGPDPLGNVVDIDDAAAKFNSVISMIIGLLTVIAGLWFIFQFITGAIEWLSGGGDKAKIEGAQRKITNSIIALIIVVIAIFLIDLIGSLIGLDILSPADFITGL